MADIAGTVYPQYIFRKLTQIIFNNTNPYTQTYIHTDLLSNKLLASIRDWSYQIPGHGLKSSNQIHSCCLKLSNQMCASGFKLANQTQEHVILCQAVESGKIYRSV